MSITMSEVLQKDAPTFEDWLDGQDFDYQRTESKIVDYVNSVIDYETLDDALPEASDIEGWEAFFEQCGIEKESERAVAAKNHITAYVELRSA